MGRGKVSPLLDVHLVTTSTETGSDTGMTQHRLLVTSSPLFSPHFFFSSCSSARSLPSLEARIPRRTFSTLCLRVRPSCLNEIVILLLLYVKNTEACFNSVLVLTFGTSRSKSKKKNKNNRHVLLIKKQSADICMRDVYLDDSKKNSRPEYLMIIDEHREN